MGQEQSSPIDESIPPQNLKDRSLESVAEYIRDGHAKNVVIMVGAGISTSAGIPDFRSPDTGLYSNLARLNLPYPEAVFDISFFRNNPLPFYTLAHELYPGRYRPTVSHSFIRLLSDKGLLLKLFTQNIDCLEREAGVPEDKIVEAHGSFATQRCIECKSPYPEDLMKHKVSKAEVPYCLTPQCNGLVKPDIVFFGEPLPENFNRNRALPSAADLCIIMGTSLTVQPFASLPSFCSEGVPRVLINLGRVGGLGSRTDDVIILSDCDAGVRIFATALGWSKELEARWEETKPKHKDELGSRELAQMGKDQKLEDQITKLTQEVDESLKITDEHSAWLREHLAEKQEKDTQMKENESPAIPTTEEHTKVVTTSQTGEESAEAKALLHSTSEDQTRASSETSGHSDPANTQPGKMKKPSL